MKRIRSALWMAAVSAPLLAAALPAESVAAAGSFPGMDEAVNEKLAESAGAAPRAPYIDTESMGDLWNMLLLMSGAACGFVIGRWWHLLFGKNKKT